MTTKRRNHHPTIERINELLVYDPETGIFRAKVRQKGSNRGPSDVVGCPTKMGHLRIQIDGESWYLHNIAWFIIYGEWPCADLDHRDLNPRNNAILNLREGSRSHNNANMPRPSHNTSGTKGVGWIERLGKWRATIQVNNRTLHLGCYETVEDAHLAYIAAAHEHFGQFARVN